MRAPYPLLVLAVLLSVSCAGRPGIANGSKGGSVASDPGRTLVMISGGEPPSFALLALQTSAIDIRSNNSKHVLNATLTELDPRGLPLPFLAAEVPELHTASWRVFPDGRMETTYRLRPNLTWHDGQPLTANDFVFAWRVYSTPQFGIAGSAERQFIENIAAPDLQSVVVQWKQPYPAAGALEKGFPPLPRHVLERPYQELSTEAFINLAFWTDEYVGAGPWRLDRREIGAFFEASAFDGFVHGKPRIERVRVIFIADNNAAIATLLAGEADYSIEGILAGEEGLALERGWGSGGGKVIWEPTAGRAVVVQFRPEFAVPTQLATDVRVRKALAFLIDREPMVQAVTAGHGVVRELYTHPKADHYDTVLRAAPTRYTYDPRRAGQLLEEAGFTRGGDGFWMTPSGERFTLEQWYLARPSNQMESNILVDGWRSSGIDASTHEWGVQRTSNEERAKTSGLFSGQVNGPDQYQTRDIARPDNRWTGTNRGGYSNPELDRLVDAYDVALDPNERIRHLAQMERITNEEVPGILLLWGARVVAQSAVLKDIPQNLTPEGYNNARQIWTWEWDSVVGQ